MQPFSCLSLAFAGFLAELPIKCGLLNCRTITLSIYRLSIGCPFFLVCSAFLPFTFGCVPIHARKVPDSVRVILEFKGKEHIPFPIRIGLYRIFPYSTYLYFLVSPIGGNGNGEFFHYPPGIYRGNVGPEIINRFVIPAPAHSAVTLCGSGRIPLALTARHTPDRQRGKPTLPVPVTRTVSVRVYAR